MMHEEILLPLPQNACINNEKKKRKERQNIEDVSDSAGRDKGMREVWLYIKHNQSECLWIVEFT